MKRTSLQTKRDSITPHVLLTLLLCGMLSVVMMPARLAHAQKYSDWSAPVNLGATINSASNEQESGISKDGLSLYFTSNRAGGFGGFDMYVSQRASFDEPWGTPVNLGPTVNTAFDDGNPSFSRDEHFMFFQSKRPGGFGGIDIWVSQREHTHDDFDWQPAVNLGPAINSAVDDNGPCYFETDDASAQLYFRSTRGGLGGTDIYVSGQLADGSFGPAMLVTELSSASNESDPSILHNGLEVFFQSNRPGSIGPAQDLWVATRESTFDSWSTPVSLGNTVNTAGVELNAQISSDGLTLFFTSDRPGGFGGFDLYMSTRTKLRGQSEN